MRHQCAGAMEGEEEIELMTLEEFLDEPVEARQPERRWLIKAVAATATLVAATLALRSWGPSVTVTTLDGFQEKVEERDCLCLFDVDRTLTARQASVGKCANTKSPLRPNGSIPWDFAYGGGPLVLSEVGLHLDETFCAGCYMGIVTAGTASNDGPEEERGMIFARMDQASEGHAGNGSWSHFQTVPPISPLVYLCPDAQKVECAKNVVDMLNAKNASIAADEVYFFDDRWGNADEMSKYGYNGREVSCESRDYSIGNGIVGDCGALLKEIVREKGVKTCGELQKSGFYE